MAYHKCIDFQTNWNNKLDCKTFTTFRLYSDKYVFNDLYHITLKGQPIKIARCIAIKKMRLDDVNEWVAQIDTGYSIPAFRKLVLTMYKNIVKNWNEQVFVLVLLQTEKEA